ncbi:DUF3006 domain-containing protein [Anaerobium acetethylicum]|uniref:DUF3006 domain-containing protein n=1 Tax=Anaerobium acetethylicum TaxID=1619234 RepID=A0A1D3TR43_9FIRM|nr:DUF3006 domain-containing protein [Anaerobium acetethylicum]SCP96112.1 Protein of unknown function [Anaerobium acetethylicum]
MIEKLIIDRFEGGFAVCEKDDLSFIDIPVERLPRGAAEGSFLFLDADGSISLDEAGTRLQRKRIQDKFNSLFK